VIAKTTVAVAPGSTRSLSFRLNAAGRALLRHRRVVVATVRITVTDRGSATVTFSHRLTLRQPAKRARPGAAVSR
jgi:hypothetical protein